jgi:hypothetical protein
LREEFRCLGTHTEVPHVVETILDQFAGPHMPDVAWLKVFLLTSRGC